MVHPVGIVSANLAVRGPNFGFLGAHNFGLPLTGERKTMVATARSDYGQHGGAKLWSTAVGRRALELLQQRTTLPAAAGQTRDVHPYRRRGSRIKLTQTSPPRHGSGPPEPQKEGTTSPASGCGASPRTRRAYPDTDKGEAPC